MIIVFYRHENGRLVENDGWHKYDRKLVLDRIKRQNERVTYRALIRGGWCEFDVWHELDLTKSALFKKQPKQLTLF